MRQELPQIEVEVALTPATSGARSQPVIPDGYRPHFRVNRGEYLGVEFVGASRRHEGNPLTLAKVRLLYWPEVDYDALSTGAAFDVLEGPTVVGHGRVTRDAHAI
jgi:hypothetical protein